LIRAGNVRQRERLLPRAATRLWLPLALAAVIAAPPSPASTLKVEAAAASEGSFGLAVGVALGCIVADLVIPAGPVTGQQSACSTITTATPGPVTVASPGADFLAGSLIGLDNGFSIEFGQPFSATINRLIGPPVVFVTDDSPSAERFYQAFFSVRLDSLSLAPGEEFALFVGYSADQTVQFRVAMRRNAAVAENRLAIFARDDTLGGLVEHREEFPLTVGFNDIEVWWYAGAGDGSFLLSTNGAHLFGITGLDNGAGRLDFVRLGHLDGTPAATSGMLHFDDFGSFRAGF
jgi:hypothetical protein